MLLSKAGQCRRCHADTKPQFANFIYATNIVPRVMFAPAGSFCGKCPRVIIDEEMVASGVKKEFSFQGIVGIDHEGRKGPDLFKTWNGRKTIYILDEDGKPMGIRTCEEQPVHQQMAKISVKNRGDGKRKRRKAKEARRRNRRK